MEMNPYIKFQHQIREISKLDEFPRMTPLSKLIFDQVALYEAMENPLAVREMLSFNEIASPATIHKHLSALKSSGYVFATSDGNDKRTKHLVVSSQGHRYINFLSKAIKKAAVSSFN
jgi:SOS-response transcriptional repressor LexA